MKDLMRFPMQLIPYKNFHNFGFAITNPKQLLLDKEKKSEIEEWLATETIGAYRFKGVFIGFEFEEDAVHFVLVWG